MSVDAEKSDEKKKSHVNVAKYGSLGWSTSFKMRWHNKCLFEILSVIYFHNVTNIVIHFQAGLTLTHFPYEPSILSYRCSQLFSMFYPTSFWAKPQNFFVWVASNWFKSLQHFSVWLWCALKGDMQINHIIMISFVPQQFKNFHFLKDTIWK